jgi:hypothetical protein
MASYSDPKAMSISFVCEHCGHPMDVDDRLAGAHGKCKHCQEPLVVPARGESRGHGDNGADDAAGLSLRLRPLDGEEPPRVAEHLLAPPSPLTVRPADAEPRPKPAAVSDPDSDPVPSTTRRGKAPPGSGPVQDYSVLDPNRVSVTRSSVGPPPLWKLLPTLTARFFARQFRILRDRLYVVSIFFLVMVLIGYLFRVKLLLHLGALGVLAANIGILGVGVAYLVTLPFKESLKHGLANLFVPFYAVYYWTTRWPVVKTAVFRTLGSFLPIVLVAFACLVYREAPAVEQAIEDRVPALEKALDEQVPALNRIVDQVLEPLENKAGPLPDAAPGPEESSRRRGRSPGRRGPPF